MSDHIRGSEQDVAGLDAIIKDMRRFGVELGPVLGEGWFALVYEDAANPSQVYKYTTDIASYLFNTQYEDKDETGLMPDVTEDYGCVGYLADGTDVYLVKMPKYVGLSIQTWQDILGANGQKVYTSFQDLALQVRSWLSNEHKVDSALDINDGNVMMDVTNERLVLTDPLWSKTDTYIRGTM